jgi:protein required for attachment to host cells
MRSKVPGEATVVICDGARALLLRNAGSGYRPELTVEKVFEQPSPATRDQGSDKPGRRAGAQPPGQRRQAMRRGAIEQTDWHERDEALFCARVAEHLYHAAQKGELQQLLIIASPRNLGRLRQGLHKEVARRIIGEIPKDLTGHSLEQIERFLGDGGF